MDTNSSQLIRCRDCKYHTGQPGNNPNDLVCAVNTPQPTLPKLEMVDGRTASALHNCPDFEAKPKKRTFKFAIYQSNGSQQRVLEYLRFESQQEADAHCKGRSWAGVKYWAEQRN